MNEEPKKRTLTQNKALHLFFTQASDALRNEGLDMRKVLKPGIDIPWTGPMFKEFIWLPIMIAVTGKEHTKDLTTIEIDKILIILDKHFGEKFGLTVPFPCIDELIKNYEKEDSLKLKNK